MLNRIYEKILAWIQNTLPYRICHKLLNMLFSMIVRIIVCLGRYVDAYHSKSSWVNITVLLTSILSLAIYLSVGVVYADYKGERAVYILTSVIETILPFVLLWEVVCCIGSSAICRFYAWIKSKWKALAMTAIALACVFYGVIHFSTVEYYSAITEIYGIPNGVESAALSKEDLDDRTGYWKIKDQKFRNHLTLTYVDAYEQTDIMQHYSTLYNMSLFQDPVRIEIDYIKTSDKGKYRSNDQESFASASENKFREPIRICYYSNSGKLLLEMERYNDNLFKVMTYSSKDAPQLLNSLLFRVPDGQTIENDMYLPQIEITYNSAGLPETRQLVSRANLYGVSGERYVYNSDNQLSTLYFLDSYGVPVCNNIGIMTIDFQYNDSGKLQSICYYSDMGKTEKTEGFSGVFCEKFLYENEDLVERLQMGRGGSLSYDVNTVCEYRYTYKNGALVEEAYYGRNNSPVYMQLDQLYCHAVKYDRNKNYGDREISISFDLKQAQNIPESDGNTDGSSHPVENHLFSVNTRSDSNASRRIGVLRSDDVVDSETTDSEATDSEDPDSETADSEAADSEDSDSRKPDHKETDDKDLGSESPDHKETDGKDQDSKNADSKDSVVKIVSNNTPTDNEAFEVEAESNANTALGAEYDDMDFQEAHTFYSDTQFTENTDTNFPPSTYASIYFRIHKGAVRQMCYRDRTGQPTVNEHGCAVRKFQYNKMMRVIKESYLDTEGQRCLNDEGYAAIETTYIDDSSERIRSVKYLDTKDHPVNNKKTGYAVIEYKYGSASTWGYDIDNINSASQNSVSGQELDSEHMQYSGREKYVAEYYRDQHNQPVLSREYGYAGIKKTYNENGLLVGEAYYDTENMPTYRSDYGVAQIFYEYSNIGNLVCEQYFDTDGGPLNRLDTGYATVYREYEMGREVKEYYKGLQDGMLCAVTDKNNGIAIKTYGYNNGQRTEIAYYDVNQKPILRSDMGLARVKYEYENGKVSKLSFYGTSGELTLRKDSGVAIIQYEYDDAGRETFIRYYGTDEKPIISTMNYCAGFHYNYDDVQMGRSDIIYLGLDGNPMIRKDLGYAHVHYEYDDDGNISCESYWDTEKKPALCKDGGYASYTYIYDEETDCAEYRYYGTEEQPVMRKDYSYACCEEYFENEKCRERRYYNTKDELVLRSDTGYAIVRYDHDELGRRTSEKFYDTEDELVISTEYQCAGFLYDYDETGHEKSIGYIGTDDKPFIRGDRGFALVKYDYDKRGLRTSARYYDVTGETPVISTLYHCAGFDYEYDDRGNESEVHYIGLDGEPMFRRDYGNVWVHKRYDNVGNFIGEAYYDDQDKPTVWRDRGYASVEYSLENGNIREIRYYDTNHELTIRKDTGCAVEKRAYDDAGRCISRLYYDTDERLIFCGDSNCAGFRYAYDEMGNHTDTWCVGIDGNTMFCRDLGYAHVQYEYDEQGRQIKKSFYDVSDRPTLHIDEGWARCEYDYDAAGNCLETRYYDLYGHLTNRMDTGCAIEKYIYNPLGQCILEQYFDIWNEQPVIHKQYHCAGFEYKYDDRSRKTDIFYLDTTGKPMIRSDNGISYVYKRYDSFGRLEGEDYFAVHYTDDEKEHYFYLPAVWKNKGYSSFTNIYEDGQCTETYYEHNGSYVLRKDTGYAWIKWKYDEYGQCKSVRYLGTLEQPVFSDQLCAGFKYDYNEKGEQTDTWYIGLNGKPMIRSDKGFAHIHSDYDEMGNEVAVTYLDADDNPAVYLNGGYFSYKKSYLNGKCVAIRYYDEDDQLTRRNDVGYAYSIDVYERGSWIECRYYDENDSLVNRTDEGYAVYKREYNTSGELVSFTYYDTTGENPVINSYYNRAGRWYAYDGKGNQTDTWYIGLDGRPLIDKDLGYAHVHYDYNDLNQRIRTSYFDADNNPVTCINGGYFCMEQTYKDGNCIEERYYDTDRNLVLRKDAGYALVKYTYNNLWQEKERTYYGTDGERVTDKEGYAGYFYDYDDRGNQTTIWYMDVTGSYNRHDNTGGECQYKIYDEYDNLIWHYYYIYNGSDYDGDKYQLTDFDNLGYVTVHYEYDNTKIKSTSYKDENGNYTINPETGYAIMNQRYTYNGMPKLIEYQDESKKPVDINGQYAKIKYIYDPSGCLATSVYYNKSGDIVR